ncbi:MAG: YtxH domain-containing protein [Ktedonobacterales bacterium]
MRTIRAFIWGSAIGAILGLLFAPQRGDVTRAQLQERINQWQGQAQTQLNSMKETASGAIESSRKTVNSMRDQVQSMTGSGQSSSGQANLQDVSDRTQNTRNSSPTPSI